MAIIFYALLAYILYQVIFRLVIPLYRATRQVKKGFREMNERMHQAGGEPNPYGQREQQNAASSETAQHKGSPKAGDYIDFEEIK